MTLNIRRVKVTNYNEDGTPENSHFGVLATTSEGEAEFVGGYSSFEELNKAIENSGSISNFIELAPSSNSRLLWGPKTSTATSKITRSTKLL